MNSVRDLKKQLEALGDSPVPTVRPEFREALLARLLADMPASTKTKVSARAGAALDAGDDPVVVQLEPVAELAMRRRSRVVAMQAAAAVSIAAAAAGVLGVVSLVDGGKPATSISGAQSARLASNVGDQADVTITPQGRLVDSRGQAELQDGPAEMTCADAMVFHDADGNAYSCSKGEKVTVVIQHSAIASSQAQPAAQVATLNLHTPMERQPLEWDWDDYDGAGFDHYELVRVDGVDRTDAELSGAELVASTTAGRADETSVRERDELDHSATYQVRTVGADGVVLARSNLMRVTVGLEQD